MTSCALPERLLFKTDREVTSLSHLSECRLEEVLFNTPDGTRLSGLYISGDRDKPLVLFFHGTATNISQQGDIVSLLNELGVSVFLFDYRGYGMSEGTPTEEGTYNDARGALNHLSKRGWTPDRMIYFGQSLGAAVALQLALEVPPAGLVLESPFTSIGGMICHHRPFSCALFRFAFKDYYDSLSKITFVKAPLLVIQGERDMVVPERMARDLYSKAPEPKSLLVIGGASHTNTFKVGREAYLARWRDFLFQTSGVLHTPATSASCRAVSDRTD